MTVLILTTESPERSDGLAKALVESKLAACVSIVEIKKSVYYWEGKVQEEPEHLLIIKTDESKAESCRDFIKQKHSYSVPEILMIRTESLNPDYEAWLKEYLNVNL